ncbi:hypothetical protein [Bacillus sp. FJAT-52991]|uniref:Transcriptional regulator n=1 Tax=Bacillus kandeliae TaxID=3129297 RepID=A0ABZ2N8V3_9BACI
MKNQQDPFKCKDEKHAQKQNKMTEKDLDIEKIAKKVIRRNHEGLKLLSKN